jgi:hypothetical protein
MRKITGEAVTALYNHKRYSNGNTQVMQGDDGSIMMLHGHVIAIYGHDGGLQITNAGWPTNTTKERLNGLAGVGINQKAGVWYLNGEPWDGGLIKVK